MSSELCTFPIYFWSFVFNLCTYGLPWTEQQAELWFGTWKGLSCPHPHDDLMVVKSKVLCSAAERMSAWQGEIRGNCTLKAVRSPANAKETDHHHQQFSLRGEIDERRETPAELKFRTISIFLVSLMILQQFFTQRNFIFLIFSSGLFLENADTHTSGVMSRNEIMLTEISKPVFYKIFITSMLQFNFNFSLR